MVGTYVGKLIGARIEGKEAPAPFKYHQYGNLATIGRHKAVVDLGNLKRSCGIVW